MAAEAMKAEERFGLRGLLARIGAGGMNED
jgi:hypothetical protein